MTPERWRHVQAVFHDVADLPPAARAAHLDAACAGDDALRAEVEGLLAADDAPGVLADAGSALRAAFGDPTALADAESDALPAPAGPSREGVRVGPYRVVREVGRGGMGTVYLAERADGQYAQRVALKIARDDLAPAHRARFAAERQILADLEHPRIARLLDGGLTDAGVPYLVMEYVEGAPVTAYADARALSVEARLRLFRQVCEAVHFAHRHLVVHRDLKPSNVLAFDDDGAPALKLLDFGIARLLAPTADGLDPTLTVGAPLTPAYASPEQLRGEPLTTASDVYSLGVVLHELLTGARPGRPDGRRATGEPTTRPSTLVGRLRPDAPGPAADPKTVAAARGLTADRLRRRLRGDLDAILLLALRPEPERRYPSAAALADDLDRHLAGLPVHARRGTWRYRAGAFVRRHRVGVAAATVGALGLVGGAFAYTTGLARERDAARREADRAERVAGFLTDVLAMADPNRAGGAVPTAVLLDSASVRARALAGHPDTEADVLLTLAGVFERVGQADRSGPLFEAALSRKRRLYGDRHPDVTTLLVRLAEHHSNGGRYALAESLGHRALVLNEALVGPDHPFVLQALNVRAMGLQGLGRHDEADAALRRALALARRDTSEGLNGVSITLNNLARLARDRGDAVANERYTREALALRRRMFGPEHPEVANSLVNLAVALGQQGRYAEGERLFREALAMRARTQGPDHPEIGVDGGGLAGLLARKGDLAGADAAYRDALALLQRVLPRGDGSTVQLLFAHAGLLARLGRAPEAEAHLRTALADRTATLPAGHWQIAEAQERLGAHLAAHGRVAEAAALLRAALPVLTAAGHPAERFARDARRVLDSLAAR